MSSVPHKDRNFFPVRSIWVHLHVPRWVPLVQQELPTLPEHLSLPPVLSRVRVTRSLDLSVGFVDRCLSFCTFSYHCVVCSSSIYGFRLPFGIFKLYFHMSPHAEKETIISNTDRFICHIFHTFPHELTLSSIYRQLIRFYIKHVFKQQMQ